MYFTILVFTLLAVLMYPETIDELPAFFIPTMNGKPEKPITFVL